MSGIRQPEVVKTENVVTPVTKTFIDGDDKNVAVTVIYADSSNDLFYDAEFDVEVPAADCLALFLKGVVALKGTTYYKPTTCTSAGVITFPFA